MAKLINPEARRPNQCEGAYIHEEPDVQHRICSLVSRLNP